MTNPAGTLQIDTTTPTVSSVVASGTGITSGSGRSQCRQGGDSHAQHERGGDGHHGGTPTLTLNDGGTATYTGGSGTSALTFSYTVGAGQNTSDLAVTAVNANAGDHHRWRRQCRQSLRRGDQPRRHAADRYHDADGVVGGGVGHRHHQRDGDLNAGKVVTLTLNMSEAVTVAGGTPTLTLNDGGTATYTGGSGTSALTFSYTVGGGQNTSDLAVTAVNANAATITDGAGNAANLSGAVTNPSRHAADRHHDADGLVGGGVGNGITRNGDLNAGKTVTLTLNHERGGDGLRRHADADAQRRRCGDLYRRLRHQCADLQLYGWRPARTRPTWPSPRSMLNAATITDGAGNAANLSLAR